MNLKIHPSSIQGSVHIPPSKSIAHRAILCAALSKGESILTNIDYSDDINATLHAITALGATIRKQEHRLVISGIPDIFKGNEATIHCEESGSTLRFLIPLASLTNKAMVFTGKNRLLKRPLVVYQEIFEKQNQSFILKDNELFIQGALTEGHYIVDGTISSQFISGLMFALPLLPNDSLLEVKQPIESKSYIDLTVSVLRDFGVFIEEMTSENGNLCYKIKGNQCYQARNFEIEGDYSQLAFFAVLGIIHQPLQVHGMNLRSMQGDRAILSILKHADAQYKELDDGYEFFPSTIKGFTADIKDCPDLGPILMILAALATSSSKLHNTQRLRLKESDRIEAMRANLDAFHVTCQISENEVIIIPPETPIKDFCVPDIRISSFQDHRIAMAFSILACVLKKPLIIEDAHVVSKSYPGFFDDLRKLGVKIEL